jgi:hypothetical protein
MCAKRFRESYFGHDTSDGAYSSLPADLPDVCRVPLIQMIFRASFGPQCSATGHRRDFIAWAQGCVEDFKWSISFILIPAAAASTHELEIKFSTKSHASVSYFLMQNKKFMLNKEGGVFTDPVD